MNRRIDARTANPAEILEQLHRETGITPATHVSRLLAGAQEIHNLVANDQGKFKVLGVDRFDDTHWVAGEFDDPAEALAFAEAQTHDANPNGTTAEHMATVYYAYKPDGAYFASLTEPHLD